MNCLRIDEQDANIAIPSTIVITRYKLTQMNRTYGNILHYAYMTTSISILMNDIALHCIALHCILIIHVVPVQYSRVVVMRMSHQAAIY